MFKQTYKKATSIRFRRWSRAKYAIFCSLSTAVTIGKLTVSIADKSLQKAINVCLNAFFASNFDESPEDKDEKLELEASLILSRDIILTKTITDCAVACDHISLYSILSKRLKRVVPVPTAFIFNSL